MNRQRWFDDLMLLIVGFVLGFMLAVYIGGG